MRVFQLITPDLSDGAGVFTLLANPPTHNLPRFRNRFVGREALVEDIALQLSRHRLVTLTGPGGGGKSTWQSRWRGACSASTTTGRGWWSWSG